MSWVSAEAIADDLKVLYGRGSQYPATDLGNRPDSARVAASPSFAGGRQESTRVERFIRNLKENPHSWRSHNWVRSRRAMAESQSNSDGLHRCVFLLATRPHLLQKNLGLPTSLANGLVLFK